MSAPRITYAQSSDIKARSFAEYRRDMKKKAIAELEFLPFLQSTLRRMHNDDKLIVEKSGSDSELWFDAGGKLSRAPDYRAIFGDKRSFLYEFQYAEETEKLSTFDFKVSKVGEKRRGQSRIAHRDRDFFYVVKPERRFAFVAPAWIMENGKEGPVPAWGSRPAFRVARDLFMSQTNDGGEELQQTISQVDDKNLLLQFQGDFLPREVRKLARRLERAVDENEIVKIVPSDLEGFFETCLLLDKLGRHPENIGLWLVYACSFFAGGIAPLDFGRWAFCVDFLYFAASDLRDNEMREICEKIRAATSLARNQFQQDGSFATTPAVAQLEATRAALFAIDRIEDMTQHLHYRRGQSELSPIRRIYQTAPDCARVAAYIRQNNTNNKQAGG